MEPIQNIQLEKALDEALNNGDFQALDVFIERNTNEDMAIKCSQQFLSKLDKHILRSLDQKEAKSAGFGLGVLCTCGKNLEIPAGSQGLSGLIAKGLIKKWFEGCRQLWVQGGLQWDKPLFNLCEDFFEALMVVHEACKEGTYQVTELFLYPVGQLAIDPRIYILIQKEAIRTFNLILDKIPAELKKEKKILTSQEASDIMIKIAGQITEGGDYDFQIALVEALCRMATPYQRKELADRWFSMGHVASAFVKISDSEFETDCRKFLNLMNGMQGEREVYSYPCVEVYLDKNELLMPTDEKLEAFWVDFNLGSQSISFYFSSADEEEQGHWDTICINENEVQSYTVEEKGRKKVLELKLSQLVVVGAVEGSSLTIFFSSSLDILQAARSVYGTSKNIGFVGKKGTSVVKTTVKILMEENNSQVVPESQISLGESERSTAPCLIPFSSAPAQMLTPSRMRISESTTFITGSTGGIICGATSPYTLLSTNTPAKGKGKPCLQMVRSCKKKSECILGELRSTAKTKSHSTSADNAVPSSVEKQVQRKRAYQAAAAQKEPAMEQTFVPDTQPRTGGKISSNWVKMSVSEMLVMPTQKIHAFPKPERRSMVAEQQKSLSAPRKISAPLSDLICQKKLHSELTQRLQQVLNEKNQESFDMQKKKLNTQDASKGRSSRKSLASTDQKAQTFGPANRKNKRETSREKDVAQIKAPAKVAKSRAPQKKSTQNVTVEANKAINMKEKRESAAADNMVKLISKHYDNNQKSTKKSCAENLPQSWIQPPKPKRQIWFSTATRKESGPVSVVNTVSKAKASFTRQKEDIFEFSIDEPLIVGGKDKALENTSAIWNSNINDSSADLRKRKPMVKQKRHVKKHLFSDTDTDNAMTEVSWLRESGRKPLPKVTKYSRQAIKTKVASPHTSGEFSDEPRLQKPGKGNALPQKRKPDLSEKTVRPKKEGKPAAALQGTHAAGRRPKRAAATSAKSYREPDTDDSQSDSLKPPAFKKHEKTTSMVSGVKKSKDTTLDLSTEPYRRLESKKRSYPRKLSDHKLQKAISETSKLDKKSAEEQVNPLKKPWMAQQSSFCPSPPFIERMRSAERTATTLGLTCSPLISLRGSPLPASPDPPCLDIPSPILLLPKPRSTASSKGNLKLSSFYSTGTKHCLNKTSSVQSVRSVPSLTLRGHTPSGHRAAEISPIKKLSPSTTQFNLPLCTQPLLTSTQLNVDKQSISSPLDPFPEDTISHGYHKTFSRVSSVSLSLSSSKSSLHRRFKESGTAALISHKAEKTPSSERDQKPPSPHISGPSRKRHISLSSNSEEEEEDRKKSKRRGQRSLWIKPRKLFNSYAEISVEDKECQVMTPSHTGSSSHWQTETGDEDVDMEEDLEMNKVAVKRSNLCQQFNTELKRKFQYRHKMLELHNKQSYKTIQQHVSTLNTQVTKHRTERLQQIQSVLLEKIHKMEQDETVLIIMEKDLTKYWKKQITSFRSFHEQEIRSNETLGKFLQTNSCSSLEYEEKIFTSQMCLIKKDMKSVQDRLISQMQEEEIQSVKRGLHALFYP